jgi:hypothetical protein
VAKSNGSYTRQLGFTIAVTPNNDTDLADGLTRALMVGTDGNVAVTYANGKTDTLFLLAGLVHPIQVVRVRATGTTATLIKAGY